MAYVVSLFLLTFLLCSLNQATSHVYHIRTNSISTNSCVTSCLTLTEYATNFSHYLHSNTTLVFLPGIHNLKVNLSVSNIVSFSMTSETVTALVACRNYSHIHFSHSQFISLSNLELIGCGDNQVQHVEKFEIKNTKVCGSHISGTALKITETATQIVNSTFNFNRKGKVKDNIMISFGKRFLIPKKGFAGGVIIATSCKITISQSTFKNNGAEYGGSIFAQQHSIIIIHNSSFTTNSAIYGGALFSSESIIKIGASEFDINTAKDEGGVIYSSQSIVIISRSTFGDNTAILRFNLGGGGGGVLYSFRSTIIVRNSTFVRNRAVTHSRITEGGGGVLFSLECTVIIVESKFDRNIYCHLKLGWGWSTVFL